MVGIPPTFMVNLGMVLVYAIVAHHHLNMKNHHQKSWDLVEDLHLGSLKKLGDGDANHVLSIPFILHGTQIREPWRWYIKKPNKTGWWLYITIWLFNIAMENPNHEWCIFQHHGSHMGNKNPLSPTYSWISWTKSWGHNGDIHGILVQCGAPKIAKLAYKWLNSMVYGRYNYS